MNAKYCALSIALMSLNILNAQRDFSKVELKLDSLSNSVYMLTGSGGNIGLSVGDDGIFMIDDQFAGLSERIQAKFENLSEKPVTFLVNTHYHGDHTGGNTQFQKDGAVIMAHHNVRTRLAKEPDSQGLPVITFSEHATLHLNEDEIMAIHVHNAHTDGDALYYFVKANVLHTGDTFFNGQFPYIDLSSGGSIEGAIFAAETGLALINKDTKIIPGHGELASFTDYENYLKMLKGITQNIKDAIAVGKSREEISKQASLTETYITDDAASNNFITGPRIRQTIYDSLMAQD